MIYYVRSHASWVVNQKTSEATTTERELKRVRVIVLRLGNIIR